MSFTIPAALGKKSCLWVSTSTGSFPNPKKKHGDQCSGRPTLAGAQILPDKGPTSKTEPQQGSRDPRLSVQGHPFLTPSVLATSHPIPIRCQGRRIGEHSSFRRLCKSSNLICFTQIQIQWLRNTSWLVLGDRATLWWNNSVPPLNPQKSSFETGVRCPFTEEHGRVVTRTEAHLNPGTFASPRSCRNNQCQDFIWNILVSCSAWIMCFCVVCVRVCVCSQCKRKPYTGSTVDSWLLSKWRDLNKPCTYYRVKDAFAWPLVFITKKVCISTICKCFQLLAN